MPLRRSEFGLVMVCLFWSFSFFAAAQTANDTYYGAEFAQVSAGNIHDEALKKFLFTVLSSAHVSHPNAPDEILASCSLRSPPNLNGCYEHKSVGYDGARRQLFGRLHLKNIAGSYAIHCAYCDVDLTSADFPKNAGPAPGKIPSNDVINAEHTWPQSRFSHSFPTDLQKSDLHALFPVRSKVNSLRGNHPFGDVIQTEEQICPKSELGWTSRGGKGAHFEPPENHRGNVARAIFYFSVRYKMAVDEEQEAALKKWNSQDPVDSEELSRNNEIMKLQGNRNPFIDHPELIDQIKDF